ncbi:hypothetical protein E4U27_008444, partial [Claviceps purpurea]
AAEAWAKSGVDETKNSRCPQTSSDAAKNPPLDTIQGVGPTAAINQRSTFSFLVGHSHAVTLSYPRALVAFTRRETRSNALTVLSLPPHPRTTY